MSFLRGIITVSMEEYLSLIVHWTTSLERPHSQNQQASYHFQIKGTKLKD